LRIRDFQEGKIHVYDQITKSKKNYMPLKLVRH
jgi:hypothetical protein